MGLTGAAVPAASPLRAGPRVGATGGPPVVAGVVGVGLLACRAAEDARP